MKKLIFASIIAVLCGFAGVEFIEYYLISSDRVWLVFSFFCFVCFIIGVLLATNLDRW